MKEIEAAGIHIDDTPDILLSELLEWAYPFLLYLRHRTSSLRCSMSNGCAHPSGMPLSHASPSNTRGKMVPIIYLVPLKNCAELRSLLMRGAEEPASAGYPRRPLCLGRERGRKESESDNEPDSAALHNALLASPHLLYCLGHSATVGSVLYILSSVQFPSNEQPVVRAVHAIVGIFARPVMQRTA
jgi:hypothetical protein